MSSDIFTGHKVEEGRERLAEVRGWRDAAVADGWDIQPTYRSEPVESAASMAHPEGFTAMLLMRDYTETAPKFGAPRIEANLAVWGPDGLTIKAPAEYSMDAIRAAIRTCGTCGATDVDTERYSFAGRCCQQCLPEMRRKYEQPGWDN